MMRKLLIVILVFLFSLYGSVFALENLDELETRTARRSVNTFYSGEDSGNYYIWQPQTVIYKDTTTDHEGWIFSSLDDSSDGVGRYSEYGWIPWSADGKRMAIHIDVDPGSYTVQYGNPWFMLRSDGTYLRPFAEGPARTSYKQRYWDWNRAVADQANQLGYNTSGRSGTDQDTVYRVTVTDTGGSYAALVELGFGDSRSYNNMKGSVTSDGKYQVFSSQAAEAETGPFYFVDLVNGTNVINWNIDDLGLNTYWAGTTINNHLHDQSFVGNSVYGYWLEFYWSTPNRCHWRAQMQGSDNGTPDYTHDTSDPYLWWEGTAAQKEIQVFGGHETADLPRPWTWNGYWSHEGHSPNGRHVIFGDGNQYCDGDWGAGPTVDHIDSQDENFACNKYLDGWNNYTAWSAWTDYPISVGTVLAAIKYDSDSGHYEILDSHSAYSNEFIRPGLSPDGTKAAIHTSWLIDNPSTNKRNLLIGVSYYPHPPEITACTATGGVVTVTWDWATDGTSRGYTTRGWPDESTDDPPPPRETEKFRLWRCTGTCTATSGTWTPLNTTNASIFTMYDFSDGTWAAGDSWTITDTVSDGTYYYAVTSVEWSGLESRCLSNVSKIVVSSGSGTGSTDEVAYPASPGDLDNISASDFYASFNTSNGNLIRYYNIYAADGQNPSIHQQDLIASISHNHCSGGSCSWVDWLGKDDDSTLYYVTAVDTQGRESASNYVTSQSRSTDTPNSNQYTISWDDMYGSDQFAPTLSTATIAASGTSITLAHNENVNVGTGGNGGWTITPSGGAATLSYSSGDGTSSLVYTISRTIYSGETATVSYTQPGDGIEDDAGNDLANITDDAVSNSSSQSEPAAGAVTWTCVGGVGGPSVSYDATGPAVTAP